MGLLCDDIMSRKRFVAYWSSQVTNGFLSPSVGNAHIGALIIVHLNKSINKVPADRQLPDTHMVPVL